MLSDNGARESPASIALYSSVICRKIGSTIIAPPRVICCIICWEMPILKCGKRNRSGSSNVGLPRRLRRTSQYDSAASPTRPIAISAPTASPPSCQTRMPRTTPPMPGDGEHGAHHVDLRGARVGDLADQLDVGEHHRDHHDLEEKPTRQDRYVVTKPPRSGPTAAAMAAAAPTRA